MANLNSETDYLKLDRMWIDTLKGLIGKLRDENKIVVLVALSRKMSSILKVLREAYQQDTSFLEKCQVITEHVLPYFLEKFDQEKERIVIVDDAMYYGSTISQISSYIYKITSIKPYVVPVAINELVVDLPSAVILPERNENNATNAIKEKNFAFFTTQNAERIIELGQPIDMEFPILRFEVAQGSPSKKELLDKLESVLTTNFKDAVVYSITHQIISEPIKNYSVLPKEDTEYDHWNKDFSKLRFFISDKTKEVLVVAYAPGILSEDMLTSEKPLFSDNQIQELWDKVRNCDMKVWPDDGEEDSITKRIKDSYEMQCSRSRAIWVNYLASYLYLLKQKERLVKTVSEVYGKEVLETAKFSETDTCQLLPLDLVKPITEYLNDYYQDDQKDNWGVFYGLNSSVVASQELVPEDYRDEYWDMTNAGLLRCSMVKEALSVIFSNMLVIINEGKLRDDAVRRTNRLRFGMTYTALKNRLSFPLGVKNLWYDIHEWIDKNIDEATVKPFYERVVIDGISYWVRMFRAGENENSFTKMRRICEFIIGRVRQKEQRSYVERSVVEDLLTLAWEDPCGIINHTYKWDIFYRKQVGSTYCLTYNSKYDKDDEDDKGKEEEDVKNYLDFLISQKILQVLQDSLDVTRLSTIEDDRIVTPLESKQEQAISDYVDAYYFYKKTTRQLYIMNNFFPKAEKDIVGYTKKLIGCCEDFSKRMESVLLANDSQEIEPDIIREMNQTLRNIVQETIKSTNIATDNQENKNRECIRTFLQEDSKDYTDFKNKTLAAVVVNNVYNFLSLTSEEDKSSIEQMVQSNLSFIKGEDKEKEVVFEYVKMNEDIRSQKKNQKNVVDALQKILKHQIA